MPPVPRRENLIRKKIKVFGNCINDEVEDSEFGYYLKHRSLSIGEGEGG